MDSRSPGVIDSRMDFPWGPFLSFIIVLSITPGPNNLTAAAMGMRGGMKSALPFVFGVYLGVAILLTAVGFLKMAVTEFFQRYILIFKIVGSAYLLWLAWEMIRKNEDSAEGKERVPFLKGVLLQLVNPKGLVFAFTLYSLFLDTAMTPPETVAVSFVIPLVPALCVTTWAGAGTVLSRFLSNSVHRRFFYFTAAGLLVYTVVTIFLHEFSAA